MSPSFSHRPIESTSRTVKANIFAMFEIVAYSCFFEYSCIFWYDFKLCAKPMNRKKYEQLLSGQSRRQKDWAKWEIDGSPHLLDHKIRIKQMCPVVGGGRWSWYQYYSQYHHYCFSSSSTTFSSTGTTTTHHWPLSVGTSYWHHTQQTILLFRGRHNKHLLCQVGDRWFSHRYLI